jgi:hypothetical protein
MAHPLVIKLARGLNPPATVVAGANINASTVEALAYSSDEPDVVVFAGFLGNQVQGPGGTWMPLYLDLELNTCLLLESGGIVATGSIRDDAVPINQLRDVIWVKSDTPVGHAAGSQSVEAMFLTGDFTRAADYEAPVGGGTMTGNTGVFCEARTPTCCRYPSRP